MVNPKHIGFSWEIAMNEQVKKNDADILFFEKNGMGDKTQLYKKKQLALKQKIKEMFPKNA